MESSSNEHDNKKLFNLLLENVSMDLVCFCFFWKMYSSLPKWAKTKQWPLDSEFIEFEYSPKWPFSEMCRTRQTRRHSPACFARTRQTCRHSPTYFARTRQTRRHSPKAIFEKNVTRLDTFAQVMSESHKFGASGHCLAKTKKLSLSLILVNDRRRGHLVE